MKLGRLTLVQVEGVKFVVIEHHLISSKMGSWRGCITIRVCYTMTLVNTSENTVSNVVIIRRVHCVSVKISTINSTLMSLDNLVFITVDASYLFRFTTDIVVRRDSMSRLRSSSWAEICMKYLLNLLATDFLFQILAHPVFKM